MRILLEISFLGTGFCGWQVQPNGRTVQGVMTETSALLFGAPCRVTGCSRTDSGVHALSFYCTVETDREESPVPFEKIPRAYSALLPPDIAVRRAFPAPDGFHPRYSALEKEYVYRVRTAPVPDPFGFSRECFFPSPLSPDGIGRMREAGAALRGRHDFSAFMAAGSKITDPVRTVSFCEVRSDPDGQTLEIDVAADGFLYHMVRIISGTLLEIGRGVRSPDTVAALLRSGDRKGAGPTAPACGLYLKRVKYPAGVLPPDKI